MLMSILIILYYDSFDFYERFSEYLIDILLNLDLINLEFQQKLNNKQLLIRLFAFI